MSSTTTTVSRKVRSAAGSAARPGRAVPSANAVSVDIATPQPCAAGLAGVDREVDRDRHEPSRRRRRAAGSASRGRSRSSPRSNSRRASSPTTKKKNVIRPVLTHSRRSWASSWSPRRIESAVCQTASYDATSTLAQTRAAPAAARSATAPAVSPPAHRRTRRRQADPHAVRPATGSAATHPPPFAGGAVRPRETVVGHRCRAQGRRGDRHRPRGPTVGG